MDHFHLVTQSRNAKVGPIPVSTSTAATCPDACPLKAKGCYASGGPLAMHWCKVTEGARGTDWQGFVDQIAALPAGQLWRHNQAGDLPGLNNEIDHGKLADLVVANRGKRGFTYTHKPVTGTNALNRIGIRESNQGGFTINLSANTLAEADTLADLAIAPVVVIQDTAEGTRADTVTPAGRKVATCPATYRDDVTCASCQLCQRRDRKVIVGFPAHGNGKKAAAAVARG
jgi:hypothetical protein